MKNKTFNIILCIAWVLITTAYAILGALDVQMNGWNVFWPCLMVTCTYLDKIFTEKGE